MSRTILRWMGLALLAAAGAAAEQEQTQPARQPIELGPGDRVVADEKGVHRVERAAELASRGERDFRVHCVNCHGADGTGHGPVAELLVIPPADLTRIQERHGGEFPFEYVRQVIDGRELVRGHGAREMPIWGLSFQERGRDAPAEDQVRARIQQLAHYLRSIQVVDEEPEAPRPRPSR